MSWSSGQCESHAAAGEIVGLLGRSGSGKSTLLRAIRRARQALRGRVNYLGHPVTGPAAGIAMAVSRALRCSRG